MKEFLGTDFLLSNKTAEQLYFDYAARMPIIDYHNHLDPEKIANDHHFKNITQAWLDGDHYKWRAMRAQGVDESFITGNRSDFEKFEAWAATVPLTIRNPLYHWTHLELKRYFNIEDLLGEKTIKGIWDSTQQKLSDDSMGCQGLLSMMNVEILCTTDDPISDLVYHKQMAESEFSCDVLPTFRPDNAYKFVDPEVYTTYLNNLGMLADKEIKELDHLLECLKARIDYFHEAGCRLSDHGLGRIPRLQNEHNPHAVFRRIAEGTKVTADEQDSVTAHILLELGKLYFEKGWVQQFHLGALRNTNERALSQLGPDTGFDSIGDFEQASGLRELLDALDQENKLPKTILYNLNPRDNELFATMAGNFQEGPIRGKIQYGSGWWYLDQKHGMENQLNTLSNMGLISGFVGMLTDSRSFLSFPRHEYFRRILCNLIGRDVENGELPNDIEFLGSIVQDICYNNAKEYFAFESI